MESLESYLTIEGWKADLNKTKEDYSDLKNLFRPIDTTNMPPELIKYHNNTQKFGDLSGAGSLLSALSLATLGYFAEKTGNYNIAIMEYSLSGLSFLITPFFFIPHFLKKQLK